MNLAFLKKTFFFVYLLYNFTIIFSIIAFKKMLQEQYQLSPLFNYFRKSRYNVQFIKEQVYGRTCVPEQCPPCPSYEDILRILEINFFIYKK